MTAITVTIDRKLYRGNRYIGYIDDDNTVYLIIHDCAVRIGTIDHVREAAALVDAYDKAR